MYPSTTVRSTGESAFSAGTLFCGDVNDARDIEGNPKLDEAFELGKKV